MEKVSIQVIQKQKDSLSSSYKGSKRSKSLSSEESEENAEALMKTYFDLGMKQLILPLVETATKEFQASFKD